MQKSTSGTTSNYITLYNKRNNQQNERQSMEWDKIFANHISHKGLICINMQIYKQLIKFNNKNTNNITNISTETKQTFIRKKMDKPPTST